MEDDRYAGVIVRNTMRRPLVFCVAGKTVRLAPGERLEVPGSWLGGAELQVLRTSGFVKTESRERSAAEDDATKEAKTAKKAKPKQPKAES